MPSTLLLSSAPPVLTVTLNRPEVRNAFNEQMIGELTAWAEGPQPDGTRVVVLAGAGAAFCAGADLGWMAKMIAYSRDENLRDAAALARMFDAIDRLPLPIIGRVHGAALGGGIGLAAVCDIVVAAETAMFGFTEARLGIVPAVISPYAIARIGQAAARELFLTAARFPAVRARSIGLVHAVVPDAEMDDAVQSYVRELLQSGPAAIAGAKALIRAVSGRLPSEVAALTADTIARHRVSDEGQEGMRAFLDKRKARWVP